MAEDDDQADEDLTRYANFEYTHQTSVPSSGRVNSQSISEAPPAYDKLSPRARGQWLDDIPDKDISTPTRRQGY